MIAVGDDSGTLAKLCDKFRNLVKKQNDRIFDIFRKGIGTDVELIDVKMQQRLSVYVGCQSRKSVHYLDNEHQSGNLLAALQECSSHLVKDIDVRSIHWDATDFNRCIQYFRNLSGKTIEL